MHTQQQRCTRRRSSGRGAQHPPPSDAAGAGTADGAVAQLSVACMCSLAVLVVTVGGLDSIKKGCIHQSNIAVRYCALDMVFELLKQVHYASRDRPREQAASMRETGALRGLLRSSPSSALHFPWHRLTPGARFTSMVRNLSVSSQSAVHVNR